MANVRFSAKDRTFWIRAGLGALILEGLVIGVHALFFPRYFYDHFFLGANWLPKLGAYSEHLVRDAGALYLGITVATVYAARRLTPDFVQGVALANAVAALPHMIYHLAHAKQSGYLQTVPQAGTLLGTVAISLVVFGLAREEQHAAERAAAGGATAGQPESRTAQRAG